MLGQNLKTDTIDMNKLKQEEENRYASIVIDAFSRYAYIYPMKIKNSENVLKTVLKKLSKKLGRS